MKFLKNLFNILASYGLSVILLLVLMVLVFFGTIEQTRIGLYEAQQKYFESLFVVHWLFGLLPIPLPGGYLLLSLAFVNMVCGAIIRAPKRMTRPGLLLAHGGVIFLILAGYIAHHYAVTGNMPLYEGDSSSRFQSYFDWEIRITEVGPGSRGRQFVIHQDEFDALQGNTIGTFYHDELPFDIRITHYFKNCRPVSGSGSWSVDGVVLQEEPQGQSAEMNIPGVFVSLIGGPSEVGLLWGLERAPWLVRVNDREYALSLARREWQLPFTLALEQFTHERHPGTHIPSHFSSRLTLRDGESSREVVIRMNEPLRHRGYTFYQASWGPTDAREGEPLYSVLAVSRNPAGNWPLYASCLISFGLLLHFAQVLMRYLQRTRLRALE